MIEIYFEDLYWKGKLLVFTWHFKEEFDKLKKQIEFVLDVLDEGEHVLISKRQNKYNVFLPVQKEILMLVICRA